MRRRRGRQRRGLRMDERYRSRWIESLRRYVNSELTFDVGEPIERGRSRSCARVCRRDAYDANPPRVHSFELLKREQEGEHAPTC